MYNQPVSNVAQGFSPEDYSARHYIVIIDTASRAGIQGIQLITSWIVMSLHCVSHPASKPYWGRYAGMMRAISENFQTLELNMRNSIFINLFCVPVMTTNAYRYFPLTAALSGIPPHLATMKLAKT